MNPLFSRPEPSPSRPAALMALMPQPPRAAPTPSRAAPQETFPEGRGTPSRALREGFQQRSGRLPAALGKASRLASECRI